MVFMEKDYSEEMRIHLMKREKEDPRILRIFLYNTMQGHEEIFEPSFEHTSSCIRNYIVQDRAIFY